MRGRAAGARVRSRRQSRRPLGRPGQGYEWPQANHGITVDHKGNVWIGGNDPQAIRTSSSSRAMASSCNAGRPKPGRNAGRATTPRISAASRRFRRPARERGLCRRRLWQQARRGDRCRHGHVQALLGRVRQQARRHQSRPLRSCRAAGAASSAIPSTARSSPSTASSTSAIAPTIASRCSGATGPSSRKSTSGRRSATAPCGTSRSRGPAAAFIYRCRWENERIYILDCASLKTPHELRRRGPTAGPVLRRPQHRHRFEG